MGEAAGIDISTGEGIAQALAFGAQAARYLADRFAADDLGFADWQPQLLASREGRLFHHRHLVARFLFGDQRPQIERLGHLNPALMEIGVRRFAGRRTPRRLALSAALAARWSLTGGALALARSSGHPPGL